MAKKSVKNEKLPALRTRGDAARAKLLKELRDLIQSARGGVAQAVNAALVLISWQVGERIRKETLKSGRAAYGEQIISTLSRRLAADFGNGYSRPNLFRMIRFAELFPDREIVSTLSRQLSWSHFVEILQLNRDPYFLDFLGLKDAYNEKDLETAILREMEQFILELGAGFTFVARQSGL
jgi:hypothetical protein